MLTVTSHNLLDYLENMALAVEFDNVVVSFEAAVVLVASLVFEIAVAAVEVGK